MRELTSGVFEHLEVTSALDVDKIVNYTHRLLVGTVLNKYKTVLLEFKELANGISGDHWTFEATKYLTME